MSSRRSPARSLSSTDTRRAQIYTELERLDALLTRLRNDDDDGDDDGDDALSATQADRDTADALRGELAGVAADLGRARDALDATVQTRSALGGDHAAALAHARRACEVRTMRLSSSASATVWEDGPS